MRELQGVGSVFHSCCESKDVIGDDMAVHGAGHSNTRRSHVALFAAWLLGSGVCVMRMFSILEMALDLQSAVIHVVLVRGQKLSGTAQFSNQRQSPRASRDQIS